VEALDTLPKRTISELGARYDYVLVNTSWAMYTSKLAGAEPAIHHLISSLPIFEIFLGHLKQILAMRTLNYWNLRSAATTTRIGVIR